MKAAAALLAAAAFLVACAAAPPAPDPGAPLEPEASSGWTEKSGWTATKFAVATANPLASEAGDRILKAGGTAVDAAIAVQMVLALVEPQSSGLGGGAFLLYTDGATVEAFDGRETAPAAADEKLFLAPDGKPMPFFAAVVGGRSVGVPGVLRMLELAHRQHGKLPWATLFEPAISLAEQGFRISPRLHAALRSDAHLKQDPVARAFFYEPDGTPLPVGFNLRNPELAAVLRRIAKEGPDAFYRGEIAQAIVDKVRSHPANPGRMSLGDLAGYQARQREPICSGHTAQRKRYRICGFPPPSSGAIAVGQIMGILNDVRADALPLQDGLPAADWLHLYMEASRLAFADRDLYLGDPDFVPPPAGSWTSLLDPAYLAQRANLIGKESMGVAQPGTPHSVSSQFAPSAAQPEHGTSHVSIVDAYGSAVAMTTTIESQFGSRQMVSVHGGPGGFLLNNELTDFSFLPVDARGRPVANRVQPGKRPRSSMAPTLVFDEDGRLVMNVGSPGGAFIIHFVAKTLYATLHWGLDVQQAIALPNFGSLNGPSVLEAGRFPAATLDALRARGAVVRELPMTSGVQAIQKTATGFFGGADPRREGVVLGE